MKAHYDLDRPMRFPSEVRLLIWHYAVVQTEPINIKDQTKKSYDPQDLQSNKQKRQNRKKKWVQHPPLRPSLLAPALACRQFYREVTPIYYSQNTFYLTMSELPCRNDHEYDWPEKLAWFEAIRPQNLKLIQRLHINFTPLTGPEAARIFVAQFPQCRERPIAYAWTPGGDHLMFMRDYYMNDLAQAVDHFYEGCGDDLGKLARGHMLMYNVSKLLSKKLVEPMKILQEGRCVMTLQNDGDAVAKKVDGEMVELKLPRLLRKEKESGKVLDADRNEMDRLYMVGRYL